jgi:hypothetical protein
MHLDDMREVPSSAFASGRREARLEAKAARKLERIEGGRDQ